MEYNSTGDGSEDRPFKPENTEQGCEKASEQSPTEGALEMAALGFKVFPLRAGTKSGQVVKSWKQAATNDPQRIMRWGAIGHNFGVWCKGHIVLDVDTAEGKPGLETLTALMVERGLPDTRTHESARGGMHLFFRLPPGLEVTNRSTPLGGGIDVRGAGGYVVAPGSTFEGRPYVVKNRMPIAMAPEWLVEALTEGAAKAAVEAPEGLELDTPAALAHAERWLLAQPSPIKGARGSTTYKAACQLRDMAISQARALDLICEHFVARFDPPYGAGEDTTAAEVEHAYRYAQNAMGSKSIEAAGFEVLDEADILAPNASTPGELFRSASRWIGQEPKPSPFVIEKLVPQGYVTLFVSAGGRGKTMLSLTMMAAIAAGKPFMGLEAMAGEAAGLFGEDDEEELHRRSRAVCSAHGWDFDAIAARYFPTALVDSDKVLWTEAKGASHLLRRIEREVAMRSNLRLLVLDNVAQMFAAPEYDRGQVTRFVGELNRIATKHSLAIVLITHESKTSAGNDTHAASGSTAWINASRSVLKLDNVDPPGKGAGDDQARTLKHIKSNRGGLSTPIPCKVTGSGAIVADGLDIARRRACFDAVSALLRVALAPKPDGNPTENLSTSPRAKNHVAKWLRANGLSASFTDGEIDVAVQDMMAVGLSIETYLNKGKKSERYRLSEISGGSPVVPLSGGSGGSPAVAQ